MLLIDTSGLLSALFSDQNHHEACARVLRAATGRRLMSPFVLAELDYLIVKYAGVEAEAELIDEVRHGIYQVAHFERDDFDEMRSIVLRHKDLRIGIADASTVWLATKYQIADVLTLDERHFSVLKPDGRNYFRVLPADEDKPVRTVQVPDRSRTRRATRR